MSKTPILITAFKQKLHGDFWTGKARQYEHVLFCIGILASYWIIAIWASVILLSISIYECHLDAYRCYEKEQDYNYSTNSSISAFLKDAIQHQYSSCIIRDPQFVHTFFMWLELHRQLWCDWQLGNGNQRHTCAHLLISRVWGVTTRIAHLSGIDPLLLPEFPLRTPETAHTCVKNIKEKINIPNRIFQP